MKSGEMGSLREAFWVKVQRRGPDECWHWKGGKRKCGTPLFTFGNLRHSVQKVAYETIHGPVDGHVRRTCTTPDCCNPAHMSTKQEEKRMSKADRFWSKVLREDVDGCWLWQGHVDDHGYGRVRVDSNGKRANVSAHRVAYELLKGKLDASQLLDNKCGCNICCNPDHWTIKKRSEVAPKGERHGGDKLDRVSVRAIRLRLKNGDSLTDIAIDYRVSDSTIRAIRDNRTWR